MPRERTRCAWIVDDRMRDYHDTEWGVPVTDDRTQFEFLVLEGAQAGLSWRTVLNKRDAYREAFDNFDIGTVAGYGERKVKQLLANAGIIRNRQKVRSAVVNAQAAIRVIEEHGSLAGWLWGLVGNRVRVNRWKTLEEIPATTPDSDRVSKTLKKAGFSFVGSTIVYAHMQATGMVNDHVTGCYRHAECRKLATKLDLPGRS